MKIAAKFFAGLAAFFPGVTALFTFGFFAIYPPFLPPSGDWPSAPSSPIDVFSKMFGPLLPYFLTMAIVFAVSAAMVLGGVIHVFRGRRVEADKKWPWVVAMLFGAPIALPLYWHVHVWSAPGVGAGPLSMSRRAKMAIGVGALATLLTAAAIFASSAFIGGRAFSAAVRNTMQSPPPRGKISPDERNREAWRMQRVISDAAGPGMRIAQRANFANAILRGVLATIFVIHAFRSARLAKGSRVLWVFLLIFVSRLVMPIYWYLYVWKENGVAERPASVALPVVRTDQ